MHFWEYILVGATPLLGGAAALAFQRQQERLLQGVLFFSGVYLLGLTLLHLLPELYHHGQATMGLWVLGGFGLQMALEQWSGGIEHGHAHSPTLRDRHLGWQVWVGLSLHGLIEGLPLGGFHGLTGSPHHHLHQAYQPLLLGIVLHNLPAAFALTLFLQKAAFKPAQVWLLLSGFALMTPLSAFFATHWLQNPTITLILLAIVSGNLLQIATTVVAESFENKDQRHRFDKWIAFVIAVALSAISGL